MDPGRSILEIRPDLLLVEVRVVSLMSLASIARKLDLKTSGHLNLSLLKVMTLLLDSL